jgi:hypothetical protein
MTCVGFIVGLGAVTVIDIHGFLGRKSKYWTEATIRTHKVTKPLIWIGIILVSIGMFSAGLLSKLPIFLIIALVINGFFLSFYVSRRLLKQERQGKAQELLPQSLQTKITISFFVSFICWWTLAFVFVTSTLI